MNNFNSVFLAVKKHCENDEFDERPNVFEAIALDANVSLFTLGFYLDTLQTLGLIKYSFENSTIRLTSFGRKQKRLFAD
jgi:hypothetical protein